MQLTANSQANIDIHSRVVRILQNEVNLDVHFISRSEHGYYRVYEKYYDYAYNL